MIKLSSLEIGDVRMFDEKIQDFINKKCNVELADWNDGIFDGYLVALDKLFLYFLTQKKEKIILVGLAKKFITEIKLSSKTDRQEMDLSKYSSINQQFFCGKKVNISLDEKHIWSGLIGKDTEYLNVEVCSFSENTLVITNNNTLSDLSIPIEEITKIEII